MIFALNQSVMHHVKTATLRCIEYDFCSCRPIFYLCHEMLYPSRRPSTLSFSIVLHTYVNCSPVLENTRFGNLLVYVFHTLVLQLYTDGQDKGSKVEYYFNL